MNRFSLQRYGGPWDGPRFFGPFQCGAYLPPRIPPNFLATRRKDSFHLGRPALFYSYGGRRGSIQRKLIATLLNYNLWRIHRRWLNPSALPPAEDTSCALNRDPCKRSMGLRESSESLDQAAQDKAMASSPTDSPTITRFMYISAQATVLQQVRSSLPSVAAGVKGYLGFCALTHSHHFPPTPLIFMRRRAHFADGRPFAKYVRRVEKACALIGLGADRRTPEVHAEITGLGNAPVLRSQFPNILPLN